MFCRHLRCLRLQLLHPFLRRFEAGRRRLVLLSRLVLGSDKKLVVCRHLRCLRLQLLHPFLCRPQVGRHRLRLLLCLVLGDRERCVVLSGHLRGLAL